MYSAVSFILLLKDFLNSFILLSFSSQSMPLSFNAPANLNKLFALPFSYLPSLKSRITSEKLLSSVLNLFKKSYASFFIEMFILVMCTHTMYSYIKLSFLLHIMGRIHSNYFHQTQHI